MGSRSVQSPGVETWCTDRKSQPNTSHRPPEKDQSCTSSAYFNHVFYCSSNCKIYKFLKSIPCLKAGTASSQVINSDNIQNTEKS